MNPSKLAAEQPEAQSTASIWQRTRLVIILGALSTFGPLSIDMYLPALPQLARDFGANASSIQLTLSACLISRRWAQTGTVSARHNRCTRGIMVIAIGLNRILLGLGLIVSFRFGLAALLSVIGILHGAVAAGSRRPEDRSATDRGNQPR